MADISLLAVFLGLSVVHYYIEKLQHKHFNLHWLALFFHPTTVTTLHEWLVHMLVYSKYAVVGG